VIEVNGKQVEWRKDETVDGLLKRMGYSFPIVIVRVNDRVVPYTEFSRFVVPDNSKIDVVRLVSGG